jgi:hypothetical protein
MSRRAQNWSKDAKTPSAAGVRSQKPELDCCPVQPYSGSHANRCAFMGRKSPNGAQSATQSDMGADLGESPGRANEVEAFD